MTPKQIQIDWQKYAMLDFERTLSPNDLNPVRGLYALNELYVTCSVQNDCLILEDKDHSTNLKIDPDGNYYMWHGLSKGWELIGKLVRIDN